jgi:rod shape-determining protein MreD
MDETLDLRRQLWRLTFVALVALIAFVRLLPFSSGQGGLPGPDLMVALAAAWVLRRPDYVPVCLIALVMLAADFLFMRPPGLWAAVVVLGTEVLRQREAGWRDLPFLVEWALVSVVLAAMWIANAAVLALFLVDQPPLGLTLLQLILTMLAYPVAVAVTAFVFGLRRAAPGEVDELGRRL